MLSLVFGSLVLVSLGQKRLKSAAVAPARGLQWPVCRLAKALTVLGSNLRPRQVVSFVGPTQSKLRLKPDNAVTWRCSKKPGFTQVRRGLSFRLNRFVCSLAQGLRQPPAAHRVDPNADTAQRLVRAPGCRKVMLCRAWPPSAKGFVRKVVILLVKERTLDKTAMGARPVADDNKQKRAFLRRLCLFGQKADGCTNAPLLCLEPAVYGKGTC